MEFCLRAACTLQLVASELHLPPLPPCTTPGCTWAEVSLWQPTPWPTSVVDHQIICNPVALFLATIADDRFLCISLLFLARFNYPRLCSHRELLQLFPEFQQLLFDLFQVVPLGLIQAVIRAGVCSLPQWRLLFLRIRPDVKQHRLSFPMLWLQH